jgi:hypothetical protein
MREQIFGILYAAGGEHFAPLGVRFGEITQLTLGSYIFLILRG